MKKHMSFVLKVLVVLSLLVAPLLYSLGVNVRHENDVGTFITLNTVGAITSADYTYANPNANTAFQTALNALPATGGTLQVLSSGSIDFAIAVTRVIPNVTIIGTGLGTSFTLDGIGAPFVVGGNGWSFINCTFDVAPNMGATTNWSWTNVAVGAVLYNSRNSAYSVIGGAVIATSMSGGAITGTSITDSGLTATRIPYAGIGGLLVDSANLTWTAGTNTLGATNISGSVTGSISGGTVSGTTLTGTGLTPTRVPFIGAGGLVTDKAGFTFTTGIDTFAVPNISVGHITYTAITSGETRTISGALTGGGVNAILFAWHNPETVDIYIKRVVIIITTADADAANIDCGIADDAVYTNGGTEFFNDLTGETILVYDSWNAGDNGNQVKWIFCQDSVSATDGWVVAKILDNDGTSIVGSYYIEYVGK